MKSVLGNTVVGVDDANDIGLVKHFAVSPSGDRIERVHVDGRGKHAVFVDWDDLESFGGDRVMVTQSSAIAESDNQRDGDIARGSIDILGSRVLDTAGFEHGTVADVDFDGDSGKIESVRTSGGDSIDASKIRSLGSYALVVEPYGG